ncbi:MAG: hypothetical protein LBE78_07715 [Burkholderiaceae bacterium]|nr:hypothetical protein [Burkholderiaceae bacterium]
MENQRSPRAARRLGLATAAMTLALLGGCIVAPVGPYAADPYPVAADPALPGNVYYSPGYYGYAPYYYGPPLSLGFYGWSGGGHGGWHNHRSAPRQGWGRPGGSRPGGGSFRGGSRGSGSRSR